MPVRTKKRPIKIRKRISNSKPIKADDYLKKVYGDTPEPSVYLAGLRYRENMTQKELGEIIGIDQSNISKMENGERPIGKKIAKKLASIFKVDYRLFL
ncbi:MAG: helix-turn-helix transcriptional regulator [Chlamydiota bacterium]